MADSPTRSRPGLGFLDRPLTWRDLAIVCALALAVRMVNVWALSGVPNGFYFGESFPEYFSNARLWHAQGDFWTYLGGTMLLPMVRAPGYFWFLSGIFTAFGPSPAAIAAVQGIVDAGTCVLIAVLARPLGPATARLAGLSAALWPNLVIHSALVLQDSVFLFFLTGFLVLLVQFSRRPDWRRAAAAGLLFGLAFMARAVILFLPLLVPPAMAALAWWRRRRAVPTVLTPIVFLLAMLVPLSPLVYRNVTAFGTIMPTTQSGLHALYWTITLIRMDQNGTTFDQESRRTRARFQAWLKARGVSEDKLGPFEADRLRRERALIELEATPPLRIAKVWLQGAVINLLSPSILSDARVRALPRPSFYGTPGEGLFERAWAYFFADPGWFQVLVLLGLAGSLIAFALQLWGLAALFRRSRLAAVAAVLFVGYFLAISGPTAGPKYRMPFEPVMIVLFALGLEAALRRAVRRRQARDGGPEMPAGALPADGG
jgi:4-amino-4-deoxy-L-arabinose transferase-like glycosyltransferase